MKASDEEMLRTIFGAMFGEADGNEVVEGLLEYEKLPVFDLPEIVLTDGTVLVPKEEYR